jgi:hypothetical protein
MIERDQKLKRQAEFTRQHTLNKEQFKQLLDAKIQRARQYSQVDRKREILCGDR